MQVLDHVLGVISKSVRDQCTLRSSAAGCTQRTCTGWLGRVARKPSSSEFMLVLWLYDVV